MISKGVIVMKINDIKIGCHVSISKSVDLAIDRAIKIKCNTFQIFTKNPRGWKAKTLEEVEVNRFHSKLKKHKISPIFGHISYLPNIASPDPDIYTKSINSFLNEIDRCKILHIPYFVIHGGSYKCSTFKKGLKLYINSILKGIEQANGDVIILIENSSGGAKSLTGTLKNINTIINDIADKNAVQICFDTCHAFGSGYDLRDEKSVSKTLAEIESYFGLNLICLIHANDSIGKLNSNVDRHQHIGLGEIGQKGFTSLINNDYLKKKPWILETPVNEIRGDIENIQFLRSLIELE